MSLYCKRVGIIGALDEEVEQLIGMMTPVLGADLPPHLHDMGRHFYFGKIKNQEVVVVRCGVGKVNSSITAQRLIDSYDVSAVISIGVAGGVDPRLKRSDIIISEKHLHHDMLGFGGPGEIPMMDSSVFHSSEGMVACAKRACETILEKGQFHVGLNVTGDQFIQSHEKKHWLFNTFGALCSEMEGVGVAQTCNINKVPFLGIRSISDLADDDAIQSFDEHKQAAIDRLVSVVVQML